MLLPRRKSIPFHESLVLLAGLVLFLKPWLAGFADTGIAAWNTWITAALVTVIAVRGYFHPGRLWRWAIIAVAAWFAVAPWALSFSAIAPAMSVHIASAVGLAILAAASLLDHEAAR